MVSGTPTGMHGATDGLGGYRVRVLGGGGARGALAENSTASEGAGGGAMRNAWHAALDGDSA